MKKKENGYAKTFKVLGVIIFVIFFIYGIVICSIMSENYEEGAATTLFTMWLYGILLLFSCYAISEVIQILHDIRRKLYYPNNKKEE